MNKICKYAIAVFGVILLTGCGVSKDIATGSYLGEFKLENTSTFWGMIALSEDSNGVKLSILSDEVPQEKCKIVNSLNNINLSVKYVTLNKRISCLFENIQTIVQCLNKQDQVIWQKKFSNIIEPEMIIDEENNLKSIAVVAMKRSSLWRLLSLAATNGKLLCAYEIQGYKKSLVPREIKLSSDYQYLVINEAQKLSDRANIKFLVFHKDAQQKIFNFNGAINFNIAAEGKVLDGFRLCKDVFIIVLQSGQRMSLVQSQKIVFFDLNKNEKIFEYEFTSNDCVVDAAISPDHKYMVLLFYGDYLYARIYKL